MAGGERPLRVLSLGAEAQWQAAKQAAWRALEQAPARTLADDRRAWAAFHAALQAADRAGLALAVPVAATTVGWAMDGAGDGGDSVPSV